MSSLNERDTGVAAVRKLIREIVRENENKKEFNPWLPFLKNAEVISLNRNVSPSGQLRSELAEIVALARKQMVAEKLTIEMSSKCETILDKSMNAAERASMLAKMRESATPTITLEGRISGISVYIEKIKKQMLKDALRETAAAVFLATRIESGLSALPTLKPEGEGIESLVVVGKTHGKIVWERTWYKLSIIDRISTNVPVVSEYDVFLEMHQRSLRK